MRRKDTFIVLTMLLLMALLVPFVAAQEGSDPTTTTIGPLTMILPEGWLALEGYDGSIVISNVDLAAYGPEDELPPEFMGAQFSMFNTAEFAEFTEDLSPTGILNGILAIQNVEGAPEVFDVEDASMAIAMTRLNMTEQISSVFVLALSDSTTALVSVGAFDNEMMDAADEIVLQVLNTLSYEVEAPIPEETLARYEGLPTRTTEEGFPQIGEEDAPVQILEISSFSCPACRQFHDVIFTDSVLAHIAEGDVVFTYLVVHGAGNVGDGESAARASLCLEDDSLFWPYHDMLFGWQEFGNSAFLFDRLLSGAEALGVDADAFNTCFTSEAPIETINAGFSAAGELLGDRLSTPTIVVNGELVPNTPDAIEQAIEAALAAAS